MTGRFYDESFRTNALERYREKGLKPAARELGIDHKTLQRWAAQAGIHSRSVALEVSERNRVAAASANSGIAVERARAREEAVERLVKISRLASERELALLETGNFTERDLRSIADSRSKAIQQLEMLQERIQPGTETTPEGMLQTVRECFFRAVERAGLTSDQVDALRGEFALELRWSQHR